VHADRAAFSGELVGGGFGHGNRLALLFVDLIDKLLHRDLDRVPQRTGARLHTRDAVTLETLLADQAARHRDGVAGVRVLKRRLTACGAD
jgi:hypothetical protein